MPKTRLPIHRLGPGRICTHCYPTTVAWRGKWLGDRIAPSVEEFRAFEINGHNFHNLTCAIAIRLRVSTRSSRYPPSGARRRES
jgi:hypothetical protein